MSLETTLNRLDQNLKGLKELFESLPEKKQKSLLSKHGEAARVLAELYELNRNSNTFNNSESMILFSSRLSSLITLFHQLYMEFYDAQNKEDKIRLKLAKANIQKEQHDFILQDKKLKLDKKKQKEIDRHNKQVKKETQKKYEKEDKIIEALLEEIKKEETELGVEVKLGGFLFLKIVNKDHPRRVPKFEVNIYPDNEKDKPIKRFFNFKEIEEFLYREINIKLHSDLIFNIFEIKTENILKTIRITSNNLKDKSRFMDCTRNALSYIDKDLITRDW